MKAERETMKMLNAMLATLFLTMAVHEAVPQTPALKPWSAATYHGLTVGTSNRADVLQLLGKPNFSGREQDTGVPMMTYEVSDPTPGTLVVYIKKGILDGITLNPRKTLTKDDVIRLFGSNYILVHYATDDCLDDGGAAPIYQNPSGSIKHMEYRDRGLTASFAYNDAQKVDAIIFTYKPFGPSRSICAARAKKK
jgi:hypothetical protein